MKKRLATYFKRTTIGLSVLMVALILCRNYVASMILVRGGSYLLGNDVTIDRISIGWNTIAIDNFAVRERKLDGKPQLRVGKIIVQPTVWLGLQAGVWTKRISVSNVDVFLRFSRSGDLLSHFPPTGKPKETSQKAVIPTASATLRDVSVTIIQAGKRPLTIGKIECELVASTSISLRARVGELLGSSLELISELDATTYAGKTSFVLQPMQLNSQLCGELPLAPAVLKTIDLSATIACSAMVEHPANDLDIRNHAAALRIDITQVQGGEQSAAVNIPGSLEELYSALLAGGIGDHIALRAIQRHGKCSLHLDGAVAGGSVSLRADGDLKAACPHVEASIALSKVDVGQVASVVVPDMPLSAIADVTGALRGSFRDGIVEFAAQVKPTLSDICANQIHVAPIFTDVSGSGTLNIMTKQLTGAVNVSTESGGVDLAAVAAVAGSSPVTGRSSFSATAQIPLASAADPNTYSAQAVVDTRGVSVEGFQVTPVQLIASVTGGIVNVRFDPAVVTVQSLAARPADCVASIAKLSDSSEVLLIVNADCQLTEAVDPNCWNATASLSARHLAILDQQLDDFDLSLTLAGGKATLTPTEIVWQNTRCALSASGSTDGSAQIQFDAQPVSLADIARVASQYSAEPLSVSGSARAAGVATANAKSGEFQANGYLQLRDAVVQGTKIGAARIAWSASPSAVQLQSNSQDFMGGRYACGAVLTSLDWTTTQVVANFSDIPLQRLVQRAKLPAKLGGKLNGQVRLDSISSLQSLSATGRVATRDAKLGNVPFSFQTTRIGISTGKIDVKATGEIAGGSIHLAAQSSIPALQAWQSSGAAPEHIPVQVTVESTPILAQPIIAQLDRSRQLRDLRAACNLTIRRDVDAIKQGIWCTATATVDYLGYQNAVLANRLRTDIMARPSGIQLRNIGGNIAGGALQGEVDVSLGGNLSGRYRLSIERINLRRALGAVPSAARGMSGTASIAANGRIGDLMTASVRMKASNVVAGGLAIREMRMPLSADYQPRADRFTWRTRGAKAQVGGGTISLDSEGSLVRKLASFTSNVQIDHVDTTKMLRGKSINAGIVDGSINLRARRANAPEDVVGKFHIELSQMQGFEMPGFDQLLQLAKMPSFTTNRMSENDLGIVNGRIGGGLIHLEDATLAKSGIWVLVHGTSTLSGRLNLDVTAITNPSGPADGLVDLANSPLMLAAPAPVALIAKANDALKDRVVYVAVTGVAHRPTLHVQPGKTLSQDALRFVLSTAVGKQSANLAVRRPSQDSNR